MTYQHEFTAEGEEITSLPMHENSTFTIGFDMHRDGDVDDANILRIDGNIVSELEISYIEGAEGYGAIWDRVDDLCQAEFDRLCEGWAEDAAYAKAEQRYNARHADDERLADIGMDVPAR